MTATPDPEVISWLRVLFAFVFVFGLIGAMGWVLKHLSQRGFTLLNRAPAADRRLQVIESLSLDARHRLVIVRCDAAEHLLLLGAESATVVAADLKNHPRTDGPESSSL